jgi:hypothetical protein
MGKSELSRTQRTLLLMFRSRSKVSERALRMRADKDPEASVKAFLRLGLTYPLPLGEWTSERYHALSSRGREVLDRIPNVG